MKVYLISYLINIVYKGPLSGLQSVSQNSCKGINVNSTECTDIGAGHIYLLSPVLVALHFAEPLGQAIFQSCAEQPLSCNVFGCSVVLSVTRLLSAESSAQWQAVSSATSLTGERWCLNPCFSCCPFVLPKKTHPHLHSSRMLPVIFTCPSPLLLPDAHRGLVGDGRVG